MYFERYIKRLISKIQQVIKYRQLNKNRIGIRVDNQVRFLMKGP